MKQTKIFIAFIFLLAFAFQSLAQEQTTEIVWKNLQEKYENFYDIKPTIINIGNEPIYFNCNLGDSDAEFLGVRLTKKVGNDSWQWNVWKCGTISKDERKKREKEERRIEKLKKTGKYVPVGCKLNPNEEFKFDLDEKNWNNIILGDGIMYEPYKSGTFRFEFPFETVAGYEISYSPDLSIFPKEITK